MRDPIILLVHLIATLARLMGPGRRYAIRSSWWRFTQPANVRTRNCRAGGMA